jgi:hypothetical protein
VEQYGPREYVLACVENSIKLTEFHNRPKVEGGHTRRTLVLLGVRRSYCAKQDPQGVALTGESILRLFRVPSDARKEYLVSAYFKPSCIPRRFLVRRELDVAHCVSYVATSL